ncbi:unnamed protein product, partial [Iphiclides podalirius]
MKSFGNDQNFRYEKLQNYGLGKRVIPNYRRVSAAYAFPEPLASTASPFVRSPFASIYQGARKKGDKRIYIKRFNFLPKASGHRVFCEAMVACKITHIAIETTDGIPIILRGGVGYNYFKAIIRADAGVALKGSLKAYCTNDVNQ